MLTYGLYAALRLPKAPRQKDSILFTAPDIEDCLIGVSITKKAILKGIAFFFVCLLTVTKCSLGSRLRSPSLLGCLGTSLESQVFGFGSLGSRRVPTRHRLEWGSCQRLVESLRWRTLRS
jgi:hypothetical protein